MTCRLQARDKCQDIKVKVAQIELKELLPPLLPQLLEQTRDTDKLTKILYETGALSAQECEECLEEPTTFFQNLEVYRIVKKKNAGEALIDALYKTKNDHILQLLHATKFKTSTIVAKEAPAAQIFDDLKLAPIPRDSQILWRPVPTSTLWTPEQELKFPPINPWTQTIHIENLCKFQTGNFNCVLVKVFFPPDPENTRNTFKNVSPSKSDQQEEIAVTKFLESELQLDLENKKIARPAQKIYINTRCFTSKQWEGLSKFLYNYCSDSLEKLWLDNVDYPKYLEGIKWMDNLKEKDEKQPNFRFSRLKLFIFKADNFDDLNSPTFHNMLIKPKRCSVVDLWNLSQCEVQLWTARFNACHILLDPITLNCSHAVYTYAVTDEDLKVEIDNIFHASKSGYPRPNEPPKLSVDKVYYFEPQTNLVASGLHGVTHLFLQFMQESGVEAFNLVFMKLPRFQVLHKLSLVSEVPWKMDLEKLTALQNLMFINLIKADCGGVVVDTLPWKQHLLTLILDECEVTLENPITIPGVEPEPEPSSVEPSRSCFMMDRKSPNGVHQPFTITLLSHAEMSIKVMQEFCSSAYQTERHR